MVFDGLGVVVLLDGLKVGANVVLVVFVVVAFSVGAVVLKEGESVEFVVLLPGDVDEFVVVLPVVLLLLGAMVVLVVAFGAAVVTGVDGTRGSSLTLCIAKDKTFRRVGDMSRALASFVLKASCVKSVRFISITIVDCAVAIKRNGEHSAHSTRTIVIAAHRVGITRARVAVVVVVMYLYFEVCVCVPLSSSFVVPLEKQLLRFLAIHFSKFAQNHTTSQRMGHARNVSV